MAHVKAFFMLSISPTGRGQLVKMFHTVYLDQILHTNLNFNIVQPFFMQSGDEASQSIISTGQSL